MLEFASKYLRMGTDETRFQNGINQYHWIMRAEYALYYWLYFCACVKFSILRSFLNVMTSFQNYRQEEEGAAFVDNHLLARW